MKSFLKILILFWAAMVILSGCAKKPEPEPEREPAPVIDIEVSPSEIINEELERDSTETHESKDPDEKGGSTTTTNN